MSPQVHGVVVPDAASAQSDRTPSSVAPPTRGSISSGVGRAAWTTVLAFAIVAIPFVFAVVRLLVAPASHLYVSDDLALIDLHTRRALEWQQQLGVFDHNNWNHPGPAYFYLLSLGYRVFGSGARAMFVGATVLNGTAAVLSVEVVRRRSTPTRALWASLCICGLASLLATTSAGSTTYSEGALGALVSPWNPMVVIFPLMLFVLLCAAAADRSGLSLLGAALVGSFVVQTDISVLPLVAALLVVAAGAWIWTALADRRSTSAVEEAGDVTQGTLPVGRAEPGRQVRPRGPRRRRDALWFGIGTATLVVMWIPPLVQQVTNNPGNLTLLYRFFTSPQPGQTVQAAIWSVVSAFGVALVGPAEIMSSVLGGTPNHLGLAVAATVGTVVLGVVTALVGVRNRRRFAAGLGILTLLGCVVMVIAVSHVVGFVFGYLVIWAVVLPIGALIGLGVLPVPRRFRSSAGPVRMALVALAVLAGVVLTVRVALLPSIEAASDPAVGRLTGLVVPVLHPGGTVFVGDAGAGSTETRLLDAEAFIGLVNQLDSRGYRPKVNHFWTAQLGPGYIASGSVGKQIVLSTWSPSSPSAPGYRGRVGDIAVVVTGT